ncbi:MAG: hypothetical protein WB611_21475 [Stellaceae bacterium]
MADIETSVAITAQVDDLLSGMKSAADAVETAVEAIKAQFSDLSTVAQEARNNIATTSAQIESTIGALQANTVSPTGPLQMAMSPAGNMADTGYQPPGISVTQLDSATASLAGSIDDQWDLQQDYYERKQAAAEDDVQNQGKLNQQESLAYEEYLADKIDLDAGAARNSQKQWQTLLQPVENSLSSSITRIITGTSTVQNALSNLAHSAVGELVGSSVKNLFGGIGSLVGGNLFGGSDQDFSSLVGSAGGGLLGGGVFGTLFKGIGSLFGFEHGGIVPSAQGGWMVPSTSLALLHTNEMVLPANISEGLQSAIGSGGLASNSNPIVFNVSAMDSQSVATFFKNNGANLVSAINQAMRNGSALRNS